MENYIKDKQAKGYDGPSVELMKSLAGTFIPDEDMLIGRALKNNKPIGAVLIFCHGRTGTYQIGWSSSQGRQSGCRLAEAKNGTDATEYYFRLHA